MTEALELSARILAVAVLFQSIEFLLIRKSWTQVGVWRWSTLRKQIPGWGWLLGDLGFTSLIIGRILASIAVGMFPTSQLGLGTLFLSTCLIAIRWRGSFNGGSDYMTAVVSGSLWLAQVFSDHSWIARGCLAYVAVQLTASYWIAGWVKLRNPTWRKGEALSVFFQTPGYDSPPRWIQKMTESKSVRQLFSGGVIAFELFFPLAWINPKICLVLISMAVMFHVANFWIFGLNRFVFAWVAAYPALYFWSQHN